ncbi:hypothetical protein [Actinocatenispora rupis]|uniref:Uncharacterized protein n=1 Tax=Actinocatenispora rupis TaxID=519421 RepID=A0A8J3NFQ9_9ACTN|nr:hypothetical protein [Actinocatenispora rupis]GID15592.1 hypothetical protein Aru02nite_64810 [Actinocatenispora rupis]
MDTHGVLDRTPDQQSPEPTATTPTAGDLVALPPWHQQQPYRIVSAAPSPIPDWLRLDGYLIGPDGRHQHRRVDVPARHLRRLPEQRAPED